MCIKAGVRSALCADVVTRLPCLECIRQTTIHPDFREHRSAQKVMALLLLKSVFFPRSKEKAYTLLPSFGQGSRDSSIDENGVRGHESEKDVGEKKKRALSVDPRLIADATIGLSDGLYVLSKCGVHRCRTKITWLTECRTVPFALTAGLSALGDTNVVIYGGLAELIAGGISMGLGGYLGARGEA